MGFVHANTPSGTGFFVFPMEEQNLQANVPHDFRKSYPLASVEGAVSPKSYTLLKARVGGGNLHLVGLWPEDTTVKKWDVIVGGETVFFVTKSALVGTGRIVHSERSRNLAERSFGRSNAMYELIVFLADVASLDLPLAKFNEALGRKGSSPFRGFTTLSAAQIRNIEDQHGSLYAFLEAAKPPEPTPEQPPEESPPEVPPTPTPT